jgi:hypothetical protein
MNKLAVLLVFLLGTIIGCFEQAPRTQSVPANRIPAEARKELPRKP